MAGKTVIISNQPYFYKKAELFPGSAFVIGADTAVRLINVWNYFLLGSTLHDFYRVLSCTFLSIWFLPDDVIVPYTDAHIYCLWTVVLLLRKNMFYSLDIITVAQETFSGVRAICLSSVLHINLPSCVLRLEMDRFCWIKIVYFV